MFLGCQLLTSRGTMTVLYSAPPPEMAPLESAMSGMFRN